MNTQTLKGNWNVTKGKLKQQYAQLTDNDLAYEEGKEDELIGRILRRVGASRQEIENFLDSAQPEAGSRSLAEQRYGSPAQRQDNVDVPLKRDIGADTRRNVIGNSNNSSSSPPPVRTSSPNEPHTSAPADQQRRTSQEVHEASGLQLRKEQRTQNEATPSTSTARGSSGQSRQAEQQPAARHSHQRISPTGQLG